MSDKYHVHLDDTVYVPQYPGPIDKLPEGSVWKEQESIDKFVAMKEKAFQFGKVVGMPAVPSVHLKGSTNMFSIYDVNAGSGYYIAICSEGGGTEMHSVDTLVVDREVAAIIDELQALMQSVLPPRKAPGK